MSLPSRPSAAPIMVTQATLPPLEDYVGYLRQIWSNHQLTNNGPLLKQLEQLLQARLGVANLRVVSNCMSALLIAIEACEIRGEIITTPFSYVATSAAILWQKCQPVFADIRREDLTIDPDAVERAITSRTRAILATHVYGLPCAVDRLAEIARRHDLRIVYDAAHAFGCSLRGRSLASYGDVSCLSFHATKVFSTAEGGAVVVNQAAPEVAERVNYLRSFGHLGDDHRMPGINAKCSEFHAALGLCNLPLVEKFIAQRREVGRLYDQALEGLDLRRLNFSLPEFVHNSSYYPVLFSDERQLLQAKAAMNAQGVFPRRYFWPALHRLPYLAGAPCPQAEQAAATVLCLPVSGEVTAEIVDRIVHCLRAAVHR